VGGSGVNLTATTVVHGRRISVKMAGDHDGLSRPSSFADPGSGSAANMLSPGSGGAGGVGFGAGGGVINSVHGGEEAGKVATAGSIGAPSPAPAAAAAGGPSGTIVVEEEGIHCVLRPTGTFVKWWEFIVLITLLCVGIVQPFEIAFWKPSHSLSDPMVAWNTAVEIIFGIDIVLHFFTPYWCVGCLLPVGVSGGRLCGVRHSHPPPYHARCLPAAGIPRKRSGCIRMRPSPSTTSAATSCWMSPLRCRGTS